MTEKNTKEKSRVANTNKKLAALEARLKRLESILHVPVCEECGELVNMHEPPRYHLDEEGTEHWWHLKCRKDPQP